MTAPPSREEWLAIEAEVRSDTADPAYAFGDSMGPAIQCGQDQQKETGDALAPGP
jgi:hypothetical protein